MPTISSKSSTPNVVSLFQTADYTKVGATTGYEQLGTIEPSITISAGSRVRVRVTGTYENSSAAAQLIRLSVDAGASLIPLGRFPTVASAGCNISSDTIISGLSAAAHTVKVEFNSAVGTVNLRASTQPTLERFGIILEEIKA